MRTRSTHSAARGAPAGCPLEISVTRRLRGPTVPSQLFLQRERAAVLAEAETDDFINDAPKPQLDQSGEWQETSGEIQWVASENDDDVGKKDKKEEEEEELDLNKGGASLSDSLFGLLGTSPR